MVEIKMYSSPTCSHCIQAKAWLKENNIEYEDINIDEEKNAKEMQEKTGSMSTPTFIIDGKVVIGFEEDKFEKLLK
jgi:glutaredoxin-like YruB-family protein